MQSNDRQALIPLTVKQFKDATQGHLDGAWEVNGAELHQVRIAVDVLKVEKQSTFTKFDVEGSMGVVEVKFWLDNGNGVFMAERRATCRYALFLAISWLYFPMERDKTRSDGLFDN